MTPDRGNLNTAGQVGEHGPLAIVVGVRPGAGPDDEGAHPEHEWSDAGVRGDKSSGFAMPRETDALTRCKCPKR
jgi:hypothetical protein